MVVDVDRRLAGKDVANAIPVGKSHDGAQVARVLDVVEHDVQARAHLIVGIAGLGNLIHRHHVAGRGELRGIVGLVDGRAEACKQYRYCDTRRC